MTGKLDLLLVNVGGTRQKVYQDLSKDFSAIEPPFWAALTAGFVRQKGFTVDIFDANVLNLDPAATAEQVVRRGARLTAIVVYSQQANTCTPIMTAVGQLCREIKNRDSKLPLILTGWHPSALPEQTLQEEVCDMVAQGEAFYTLQGLLEKKPAHEIPGLWWREDGKIRHTPKPPNIKDLSAELSDVAWDLLPLTSGQYRAFSWMCLPDLKSRTHCASMFTSLGCPYHCKFCAIHATFGERRIRYWSTDWVMKQIDILHNQYGVININLVDELFIFNPKHYMPIAEGLIERNYGLNICAFARVDAVDRASVEDLKKLKQAGFNWFKMGIETGNEKMLRDVSKGTYGKDDVRRVVRKIYDAGIDMCANFMFGLPGDTWDTMQDTLNLAFDLNAAFPSLFCVMAPPGSDLYAEALKKGLPLPKTWEGYAQQGYDFLPLPTEHLTSAEILSFRDYAFDAYFMNPRLLHKIRQNFGPEAEEHIKCMTKFKLKRRILGD